MNIHRRKLLLNERVEVRQFEEGLRGSWHPGVVVSVSKFSRSVEYDELLSETGNSNLIEAITVTKAIEGLHCRRLVPSAYRGHIRPLHVSSDTCENLSFGICVDALFEDAWWEGVVFDCDDEADERLVFFPDESDEKKFSVSQLRITRDWDEYLGIWCDRGVWILVQLAMELEGDISSHVKILWFYLRLNGAFNQLISNWTCGFRNVWSKYFIEAANETALVSRRNKNLSNHDITTSRLSVSSRKVKKCGTLSFDGSSQIIEEKDYPLECSRRRPLKVKYLSNKKIIQNIAVSLPSITTKGKQSGEHEKIGHNRGRRNLTKSRRMTRTLADRSKKVQKKNCLHVILRKRRVSKNCQQSRSKFKPQSKMMLKEKVLADKATKNNHGTNISPKSMMLKRKRKRRDSSLSDTICSFCHYGGDLILCDTCPSTYHLECLQLKEVPMENWHCPSCCCVLCGKGDPSMSTNVCLQCARAYHIHCLSSDGDVLPTDYPSEHFCSKACYELCSQLHQLLGISNPTTVDGLTLTLTRSSKDVYKFHGMPRSNTRIKLCRILRIMHQCFRPVKEPHTQRDMARDIIYNSGSKLKRLHFHGFYVVVLHRGDEIVSVATVRIFGLKAAEMPLVATPFKYRRQGMCRLLVQELLKLLSKSGVQRLILPAIAQLRKMWKTSFGFSEMLPAERKQLSCYPFVGFQGTMMLQKDLISTRITPEINDSAKTSEDLEGNSSSISQECNYVPNEESRFAGLFYKHKENGEIIGKEKRVDSYTVKKMYAQVYKRRRVLGRKDWTPEKQ